MSDQAPPLPRTDPAAMRSGIAILVLGATAFLLPLAKFIPSAAVGWLLLLAGIAELHAATSPMRSSPGRGLLLAGAATACAGLLLVLNPLLGLFRISYVIMGWLMMRGAILLLTARYLSGPVRRWSMASALADIVLAAILIAGLPTASLIVILFGPTPELIAGFAWIFAASFFISGASLIVAARLNAST